MAPRRDDTRIVGRSPATAIAAHGLRGIRIGTSGWMYDGWRGPFYPRDLPKRRWFEHYAARFDAVELNATFYRLPAAETVERWAAAAPSGFEYSVKLGAFGSHRMKLANAESWLPNHVDRFSRLGATLGATVVQLPPRWRRSVDRLDEFLAVAEDVAPGWHWAVELREPSWIHDDVFDVLRRRGAALVVHDLLAGLPVVATAPWVYVRLHGPAAPERPYQGAYGVRRLRRWAERLRRWADGGVAARVFFNNDVGGAAVRDAELLRRLLVDAE